MKKYFKKLFFKYHIGQIRGYRKLKKSNKLDKIIEIKSRILDVPIKRQAFIRYVRCSNLNAHNSYLQYLSSNLLSLRFNQAYLYSLANNKPLCYPLPREWQFFLSENYIKVNFFASSILWRIFIFYKWLQGFSRGLKLLFNDISKKSTSNKQSVYFHDISKKTIESVINREKSVISFLIDKLEYKNIVRITHNLEIQEKNLSSKWLEFSKTNGSPILNQIETLKFFLLFIYYSLFCFLCVFIRPVNAIFLEEYLKVFRLKVVGSNKLENAYFFNNSCFLYRPLWSYHAEDRGSDVIFYFYSTNMEGFQVENRNYFLERFYITSWSRYLVWDEYQKRLIESLNNNNPRIDIFGPISLYSSEELLKIPPNSVAVFDVTPFRDSFYVKMGLPYSYYTPQNNYLFLNKINLALYKNEKNMAHKYKRKSNLINKKYFYFLRRIADRKNYFQLDTNLDARSIILKTKGCISMPFTSTALIAKKEGKPTVYFDPLGKIKSSDPAAHGIEIINTSKELESWISKNIK